MANDEQNDQIGDNAPAGSGRLINLDIEGNDRNTETRDQSHGVKDAGQEGDAPKTTDRSEYYNEDDLQVWKDRYLRGTKTLPEGMQRQGA
ncbi:hypothetical protein ACSBR1_009614 [Camellia fascicularis]